MRANEGLLADLRAARASVVDAYVLASKAALERAQEELARYVR